MGRASHSIEPSLPVTTIWVLVIRRPTAVQLPSEVPDARLSVMQEVYLPVLASKQACEIVVIGFKYNIGQPIGTSSERADEFQRMSERHAYLVIWPTCSTIKWQRFKENVLRFEGDVLFR